MCLLCLLCFLCVCVVCVCVCVCVFVFVMCTHNYTNNKKNKEGKTALIHAIEKCDLHSTAELHPDPTIQRLAKHNATNAQLKSCILLLEKGANFRTEDPV